MVHSPNLKFEVLTIQTMQQVVHVSKLIEIFCSCDDFVNELYSYSEAHFLDKTHSRKPTRIPQLSESEIMTICIFYHHSGFKCFEYYYRKLIQTSLKSYFPQAVSYERFVALMPRSMLLLFLYVNFYRCGLRSGIYYADSKKLPVCHNRRIHQHCVFKGIADRGHSSTGWFFGLKIFLVVNHLGQIIRAQLAPASRADNNYDATIRFLKNIQGLCFADKGFLSHKIFEKLYMDGLKLITGIRANMKNRLINMQEKMLLKKRGMIESVNDILMTVCDIDHTRHRSPANFFVNLFAGLAAYTFLDKVPSILSKKGFITNP